MKYKFIAAVIGCGLIGNKRAEILKKNKIKIKYCSDIDEKKLKTFSSKFNSIKYLDWRDLLKNKDIDIVIICTSHNLLSSITIKALQNNFHVMCEKPGSLNLKELLKVKKIYQRKKNLSLYYGFNHRFHPTFLKLIQIIAQKKKQIGKLMYLKASYGHGGRLGYDKEWRFQKNLSGGGELIDKGSHLIELGLIFFKNYELDYFNLNKFFWNVETDDNAFLVLKNKKKNLFFLHASSTEWKNNFIFEVFFKKAKFLIKGLGKSYGREELHYYQMKKKMGKPNIKKFIFSDKDRSWDLEIEEFLKNVKNKKNYSNIGNALKVQKIISKIYDQI